VTVQHVALYPGSFDPVSKGHVDVAERASRLFDEVVLGIYSGDEVADKKALFSTEERQRFARAALEHVPNLRVEIFHGLTVDYAREVGALTIVRGLRAVSDFEYEFKMAHMNRHLAPDIDVVCLMTSSQNSFISSSFIKQVALLGGDVRGMVPDVVVDALAEKFGAAAKR
jgi:pantetheine-phosphate adenylyltransferase